MIGESTKTSWILRASNADYSMAGYFIYSVIKNVLAHCEECAGSAMPGQRSKSHYCTYSEHSSRLSQAYVYTRSWQRLCSAIRKVTPNIFNRIIEVLLYNTSFKCLAADEIIWLHTKKARSAWKKNNADVIIAQHRLCTSLPLAMTCMQFRAPRHRSRRNPTNNLVSHFDSGTSIVNRVPVSASWEGFFSMHSPTPAHLDGPFRKSTLHWLD